MTYTVRPIQPPSDPRSMAAYVLHYLEYLKVKDYSAQLIEFRRMALRLFLTWLTERGIARLTEVTRPILERYATHLHYTVHHQLGTPLTVRSQIARLIALRRFFRYLVQQNHLLYNPAAELELPRKPKTLPRDVLTAEEAERILSQPDLDDPLGVRDRAILEVLYSTGIRRTELARLQCQDVQVQRGVLFVRQGKGGKDRYVPIGERALLWVEKYLADVRPLYAMPNDPHSLFLTERGTAMYKNHLGIRVKRYVQRSGVGKQGSCHLFRHTMATLMLENGADIRFIQLILGHSDLATTEIYTHVAIHKLKAVHTLTHPAKLPERVQQRLTTALSERAAYVPTPQDVLAALTAEADEEEDEADT